MRWPFFLLPASGIGFAINSPLEVPFSVRVTIEAYSIEISSSLSSARSGTTVTSTVVPSETEPLCIPSQNPHEIGGETQCVCGSGIDAVVLPLLPSSSMCAYTALPTMTAAPPPSTTKPPPPYTRTDPISGLIWSCESSSTQPMAGVIVTYCAGASAIIGTDMAIATHVPYQKGTCNVHIHEWALGDSYPVHVQLNVSDGGNHLLNYTEATTTWGGSVIILQRYLGGLPYDIEVRFPSKPDLNHPIYGPAAIYAGYEEYMVNVSAGQTQWGSADTDESHLPYCKVGGWNNGGSFADFFESLFGVDHVPISSVLPLYKSLHAGVEQSAITLSRITDALLSKNFQQRYQLRGKILKSHLSGSMASFPAEIWYMICGAIWEISPESLRALSLVNGKCYHAAVPFLYGTLSIKVSSQEGLRQFVNELLDSPLRQQYIKHARKLNIRGKMPRLAASMARYPTKGIRGNRPGDVIYQDDDLEPCFDKYAFTYDEKDDGPAEVSRSWEPLTSLISQLKHLTELNYVCVNQFPPCLLEALHKHHPACRLNLNSFRFRSLREPKTDPYEMELISSPCLHSISVRHVTRDSNGHEDYNEDAIFQAVAIAPNLKHVKLLRCIPERTAELHEVAHIPRQPWKGFVPPVKIDRVGNLTSLSFSRLMVTTEEKLEQWNQYTDLSKLRTLAFGSPWRSDVLMKAATMAPFKSLERLSIYLEPSSQDNDFRLATEMFFESLNPLKTLRLHGKMDTSLVWKILERHGCALRELVLDPYGFGFVELDISGFGECCPLLEELHVPVKRRKGNHRETHCYEEIGKFASLKKLFLRLDMRERDLPSTDEYEDELDDFDRQRTIPQNSRIFGPNNNESILNFHVRDALINAAVDEKLARAIWDRIATNQPSGRLSSMTITPKEPGYFGPITSPFELEIRVENLARSFLVTKNATSSSGSSEVKVIETTKEEREERDECQRQIVARLESWGCEIHDDDVHLVFERIWPPKPGSRDWRDDWSSWPLEPSI